MHIRILDSFLRKLIYTTCLLLVSATVLFAQRPQAEPDNQTLPPVSGTYAITNVTIVQAPGRKIENGTIIIKDGLIKSVGKSIAIPVEAIVIKADSMFVYAGFIDGLSHAGVVKPKDEQREKAKDPGNPPPAIARINPQVDVRASLSPSDKSVEELRNVGFTVAQVVPYGNFLPGKAAIVLLNGKSADDMVLAEQTALYSELTGARGVYPGTVMAVMAKWRELYRQAIQAKAYEAAYATNRSGLQRPANDHILEAFYPVIEQRIPVLFKAEDMIETQRVFTLKNDLGFPLVIADVKEGWLILDKIKKSGSKIFLSLDLPEEMKDDKNEGAKDEKKKPEKTEPTTPEKLALEKRKKDAIATYTAQAAAFTKAGVTFGFSSFSAKPKDVQANLRRMIAAGLSEDVALASLTTTPAQMLGVSDRMGSIDAGKMANLVITDKSYFDEKAKVRYVFVDGAMFKQEVKEIKKGDPNAKVDIEGSWSTVVESPQGKMESKLTFAKDGSGYKGTVSGSTMPAPADMKDVSLEGNALSFTYTLTAGGQSIEVEVTVTIEGTSLSGSATVAAYGSMPLTGTKDPKN